MPGKCGGAGPVGDDAEFGWFAADGEVGDGAAVVERCACPPGAGLARPVLRALGPAVSLAKPRAVVASHRSRCPAGSRLPIVMLVHCWWAGRVSAFARAGSSAPPAASRFKVTSPASWRAYPSLAATSPRIGTSLMIERVQAPEEGRS